MAQENQEYEMGNGDQGQDNQYNQDEQMNGQENGGDGPADSGSAEAPSKDDDRKLFVGSLSWETSDKELRDHFSTYCNIESINVKTDPNTGRSRHGKIFVGGLSTELSNDDIKNYFAQYGTIVEVEMPYDKSKNQRKGFCFITFES